MSDPVLARRCELPVVRLCICRGEGGCNGSKRPLSYRGESGDCGRIAGEGRGEGILGEVGPEEREGDNPLVGAFLLICFAASATMLVLPDMQTFERSMCQKYYVARMLSESVVEVAES